jgi:putative DNA methylase
LARRLGSNAEVARDLAYRLYVICDHKRWAQEALAYNGLVVAWPQIQRLAAAQPVSAGPSQTSFEV